MRRQITAAVLALCLALSLLPVGAQAAESSGEWGTNLTWTCDGTTLTLQGSGAMSNTDTDMPAETATWKTSVTRVVIETGVLSVGKAAFKDWTALTSVSLPQGLAAVGDNAFNGCSALTQADLPTSVRYIGDYAFAGTKITAANIPNGVLEIDTGAFNGCTALESVEIPGSVLKIGSKAFEGCTALKTANGLGTVGNIGTYAFSGCTSLTSIDLCEGATVNPMAFQDCTSLTKVVIPPHCTLANNLSTSSGDAYTFKGCTGLTEITLPQFRSGGYKAFYGCTKVTTVHWGGNEWFPQTWGLDTNKNLTVINDNPISNGDFDATGGNCVWYYHESTNVLEIIINTKTTTGTCVISPQESGMPWDQYLATNPLITVRAGNTDRKFRVENGVFAPGTVLHVYYGYTVLRNAPFPANVTVHPLKSVKKVEATCRCPGATEGTVCLKAGCTLAGAIEPQVIPQKPHNVKDDEHFNETAPTCTSSGLAFGKYCYDHLNPNASPFTLLEPLEIPPTNHSWSSEKWTRTKAPTCTDTGLNTNFKECTKCGAVLITGTTVVPVDTTSYFSHNYGDWKVTKEPTETEEGEETQLCSRCGNPRTQKIPAHPSGTYIITFDTQGGLSNRHTTITKDDGTCSMLESTREGYYRIGWWSAPNGGTQYYSNTKFKQNTTVYIRWEKMPYTITFDPNGSTTGSKQTARADGTTGFVPANQWPSSSSSWSVVDKNTENKTIYHFDGWFTEKTGGEKVDSSKAFTESTTLYAHWTPRVQYKVTLFNGGDLPANQQTLYTDADGSGRLSGGLPTPTWEHHRFLGWFTDTDSGVEVTGTPVFTRATRLQAHWERVPYTVTFDPNGGEFPDPSERTMTTNQEGKLDTMPVPSRDGYVFWGWFTTDTKEIDEDKVYTANTTLRARWNIDPTRIRKITLNANGGTFSGNEAAQEYSGVLDQYIHDPIHPTRAGHTFAGWYTAAEGGDLITFPYLVQETNPTFYAHWTENTYTITLDPNGGTLPEGQSPALTTGAGGVLSGTLPEPQREKHTFLGWYTAETGGDPVTLPHTFSGDTTLWARWIQGPYTVTLDLQGGTLPAGQDTTLQTNVNNGNRLDALPDPSREGHQFDGWSTASSGGEWVTKDSHPFTGDATIYAQWSSVVTPTEWTVTYDLNYDGSPPGTQVRVSSGGTLTVPTLDPVRDGFRFTGWYRESSCKTAWSFDTDTVTKDFTLYAGWVPENCTVTFDLNYPGAAGAPAPQLIANGGTAAEPAPAPVREYYDFGGWYKESACENPWAFDTDRVTKNTTLYARWVRRTHTVTFHLNYDGAPAPTAVPVNSGDTAARPADPLREGYDFGGWYRDPNCFTAYSFESTVVTSDLALYAKWTLKTYTVTFDLNDAAGPPAAGGSTPQPVVHGGRVTRPDPDPTRAGFLLEGWYREAACTTPWDFAADTVTGDTTLYARWLPVYTVTFDLNYTEDDGTAVPPFAVLTTGTDGKLTALPAPAPMRTGYTFLGWYTGRSGGTEITAAYVFPRATTVYANWRQEGEPEKGATVTFYMDEGEGGEVHAVRTTQADHTVEWPAEPRRDGHTFKGWYSAEGVEYLAGASFYADTALYARWEKQPDPPPDPPAKGFTISFRLNYTGAAETIEAQRTDEKGVLAAGSWPPEPRRSGYTFQGWYADAAGSGSACTAQTVFQRDTTLYAKWEKEETPPTPGGYYRILYPDRVTGGTFEVSHSRAREGTTVTVTLYPRSSYELDRLEVVNADSGGQVRCRERDDDEYTFTMPGGDVELLLSYRRRDSGGYALPAEPVIPMTGWYYLNGRIYTAAGELVPDRTLLTRDMLLSILYNREGGGAEGHQVWATHNGIVPDYYEGGYYGTDKPLTREQAAMILYCYAQYRHYNTAQRSRLTGFDDYRQIRSLALPAMSWAHGAGLLTGTSSTTLSPTATLTCGQACVLLSRFAARVSWGW